ncbi:MAG: adenylate/guanylate cyclase domain-containing protein [Planctomycetales bacterium]
MEVVRAYSQLAMYNVGDEQGNFLMPKEYQDGRIDTKVIRATNTPPSVTWKRRDRDGRVTKVETSHTIEYDPRTRPWYIGAKQERGLFWTEIYILFTDRQPGITASYPIFDSQGEVSGVFGLDIELGELSEFLTTLQVGNNGVALIINAKDEVVASPYHDRIVIPEGDSLRPVQLDELAVEWITAASVEYREHQKRHFDYEGAVERYRASFTPLPPELGTDWTVVVLVPEDDFIGALKRSHLNALFISVGILVIAVFAALVLSRSISRPIAVLSAQTDQIREFRLSQPVETDSRIVEIQMMSKALEAMRVGLTAFDKYVPAELVRQLIQTGEEARLGGQSREMTIFFSDIADFTNISEQLAPEPLFIQLSDYFDRLTTIIQTEDGTIDKFIGDCIMAFWGAPVWGPNHAIDACRAALQCRNATAELNRRWQSEGKPPFVTRIGIHSGPVVVGNVGSTERMNYTVLGDSVNVASRLEGVNKVYGTGIIVSETTHDAAIEQFAFRPLDLVRVKGKEEPLKIYELVADLTDAPAAEVLDRCNAFGVGFDAFQARDWGKAIKFYERLTKGQPDDQVANLFLERCIRFRQEPPGTDWDGVVTLESK